MTYMLRIGMFCIGSPDEVEVMVIIPEETSGTDIAQDYTTIDVVTEDATVRGDLSL